MKLLTVIVNYCTAKHVLEALESLVPQLVALGDAAVWIVDNKSPDDSLSVLEQAIKGRAYGRAPDRGA
jgi:GT2 family glycosyltransferase